MTIPQITPLPDPPTTQDIENFDERGDAFLPAIVQAAKEMNQVVLFVNDAAMDVDSMESIRDDAIQARDDTQQIREDAEQSLTQIGEQKIADMDALTNQRIGVMDGIRDDASQSATSAAASAAAAGQAAGFPEYLAGTEGKPLTRMRDGSGVHFSEEFTPFITVTDDVNLVIGERYRVDTSAGAFNLTLPASPFLGATIFLFDAKGTWAKNRPKLLRNGQTIMGVDEDMNLNLKFSSPEMVFDGETWRAL